MVGVLVPLLNMDEIDDRPFPSCPLPLCQKKSSSETSHENLFCPHNPFLTDQTHFLIKAFARGLVLKQRHKVTWKWGIGYSLNTSCRIC